MKWSELTREEKDKRNARVRAWTAKNKDKVSARNKRHREENRYTEFFLTGRIYNDQGSNSKVRGHQPPAYTLEEFREWFAVQSNKAKLWKAWEESGYDKWSAPSVDRLDQTKGYSFDNIELVDYKTNDARERQRKLER